MKLEDFKNNNYSEENSSDENYIEFSQELDFEMNTPDIKTEKSVEKNIEKDDSIVEFDLPKNQSSSIKVIGLEEEEVML